MPGCEESSSLCQNTLVIFFIRVISLSFQLVLFSLQIGFPSGSVLPHVMVEQMRMLSVMILCWKTRASVKEVENVERVVAQI